MIYSHLVESVKRQSRYTIVSKQELIVKIQVFFRILQQQNIADCINAQQLKTILRILHEKLQWKSLDFLGWKNTKLHVGDRKSVVLHHHNSFHTTSHLSHPSLSYYSHPSASLLLLTITNPPLHHHHSPLTQKGHITQSLVSLVSTRQSDCACVCVPVDTWSFVSSLCFSVN